MVSGEHSCVVVVEHSDDLDRMLRFFRKDVGGKYASREEEQLYFALEQPSYDFQVETLELWKRRVLYIHSYRTSVDQLFEGRTIGGLFFDEI